MRINRMRRVKSVLGAAVLWLHAEVALAATAGVGGVDNKYGGMLVDAKNFLLSHVNSLLVLALVAAGILQLLNKNVMGMVEAFAAFVIIAGIVVWVGTSGSLTASLGALVP